MSKSKIYRELSKLELPNSEKTERAELKREAENRQRKKQAKAKSRKRVTERPNAGLPGETRFSTIIGLTSSPTSKKWNMFLREGPYWNYLVKFISKRNIFRGRQDLIEEAVMNTCEKIGKFLVSKQFKYHEAGKGYFRAFLKQVAFRTALDLYRSERRHEQVFVRDEDADEATELAQMHEDMEKSEARQRKKLAETEPSQDLETEIAPCSEHDLDVYDASAELDRNIAPAPKKPKGKWISLARMDDDPFLDEDEAPSSYDPASFFEHLMKISKEDLRWVQRLQLHIVYLALGYILTDVKVSADKREMLRLRVGLDMKPQDIYNLPRFKGKNRDSLDQTMSRAMKDLGKEARSWWKMVAPDKNDFADETVMRFWRELGGDANRAQIASRLQDKANEKAGRLDA